MKKITKNEASGKRKLVWEYKRIGPRERKIILCLLIGAFFIGFSVSFAFFKISYQQKLSAISTPVSPIPLPALLQITTSKTKITKGETFPVVLTLDTFDRPIEAANFDLKYDPQYLTPVKYATGNFFRFYPKKENVNNLITIYGATDVENNIFIIPKGEGTIATVTFEAIKTTPNTTLGIDSKTSTIGSKGINILQKTDDLNIKIE